MIPMCAMRDDGRPQPMSALTRENRPCYPPFVVHA